VLETKNWFSVKKTKRAAGTVSPIRTGGSIAAK